MDKFSKHIPKGLQASNCFQIDFRFRLAVVPDWSSSSANAVRDRSEACGASVSYGVADNLGTASLKMIPDGRLLGEDSRSNPAGMVFQVAVNGGATFIWFVTIAADHTEACIQRLGFPSVISVSL